MRLLFLSFLATGLLTTALRAAEPTARPTSRPSAEEDVFEAVFRYQIEQNVGRQRQKAALFYLSLPVRGESDDPDDAFMQRFSGYRPPVRKISERKASGPKPEVVFSIESIDWTAGKAEVHAGCRGTGIYGAGSVYTVEKVNGKWKVTAAKPEWIE